MINELDLKETEQKIYAIIYGFCQSKGFFDLSWEYLSRATKTTKPTINKYLKSLVDKKYIFKEYVYINKVKRCKYTINWEVVKNIYGGGKNSLQGVVKDFNGGSKNSLHYITNNNTNYITIYKDIVGYLNLKANSNYKYTRPKTQDLIRARLNEGFNVDDFKVVIDKKVTEWGDDKKMSKYLRPETLFGNKFEGYLNQKDVKQKKETNNPFLRMLEEEEFNG